VEAVHLIRYALGVAAIAFAGPTLLFLLRPSVIRAWFEAGPEGIGKAASPAALGLIAVLRELGFEALGVKAEKTPLRPIVRELAFVAADRQCYASVAARPPGTRFYYYTPLAAGGFVLTSNSAFPKIASATVVQQSHLGGDPRALLERHHETLAKLGQRGEVIASDQARLDATCAYYADPAVRAAMRRTGLFLLVWVALLGWLLLRP